jgi:hypothetical protein
MKRTKALLLIVSLVIGVTALSGCGGSNAGVASTGSFQKFEDVLNRVMKSNDMVNGNGPSTPQAMAQPEPTTPGMAAPNLVGQIQFKAMRSKVGITRDGEDGTGGSMVGQVYFDDTFGVWCKVELMQTEVGEHGEIVAKDYKVTHWLDQELTQPAGETTHKTTVENGKEISIYRSSYTAGKAKGYLNESKSITDRATGNIEMENQFIDPMNQVSYSGKSLINVQNRSFRFEYVTNFPNGTSQEFEASYDPEGYRLKSKDSSGYTVDMMLKNDGSGTVNIAGNDPLLPASGVWGTDLKGIMTFKDGSQVPFDLSEGFFNF